MDIWRHMGFLPHTMEYYITLKRKLLIHATTWINLKGLVLTKGSQTPKAMQVARAWEWGWAGLKKGTKECFLNDENVLYLDCGDSYQS